MPNSDMNVVAVDTAIGGDAAAPGIAQPITLTEVQDILNSPEPVMARVKKLSDIQNDLVARNTADVESGFGGLIAEIDRALAILTGSPAGNMSPEMASLTDGANTKK